MEILLIEDYAGDVLLTRTALRKAPVSSNLSVVSTGEEALRFLSKESEYVEAPTPDLILLDLNLPGMSGIEVLDAIKSNPTTLSIPVVVLTSSAADEDIAKSFSRHCNSYMVKPTGFQPFVRFVLALEEWWFRLGRLPPKD